MERFKGKSMLVTGGGSGIGAATARHLVDSGAHVTICGRRQDSINQIGLELGPACQVVQGDITVDVDRERILDSALAHGNGLDGLVNNAGNMYRAALADLDLSLIHI